jgi:hypothetical protein
LIARTAASVPSSAVEIPDSIAEDEFVDDGDGRDMNEADVEEAAAAEVRRRSLFQQRMQSRRSEAPMDETDAKVCHFAIIFIGFEYNFIAKNADSRHCRF